MISIQNSLIIQTINASKAIKFPINMQQPLKNHLKNKYVACINKSPILFTAPHSKRLQRGGKAYGEKVRIHNRELYTSFLACDFAKGTGKNSFMFWGVSSVISEQDLDPNYLLKHHFQSSPFHQSLHYWGFINTQIPLFHVDIHGKMDRQKDCEIDVGIRSMEAHWEGDPLVKQIRMFFEKNGNIFNGHKFGKYECFFNTEPCLHGYWGCEIHTMTEQAILLGIPSIQLEIPFSVRKKLFKDQKLRGQFHALLKKLYETVIVSDFKERGRKYGISKQLSLKFQPTVSKGKEEDQTYAQVLSFQRKQQVSPNSNGYI